MCADASRSRAQVVRSQDCDVDDLPADLSLVMGNANQLEQAFVNLLTSARDAVLEDDGSARIGEIALRGG